MNYWKPIVTVHLGGKRFSDRTATRGSDGSLYLEHGGRWWKLSKPATRELHGRTGWHSFNVSMPNDFQPLKELPKNASQS